MGHPRRLLKSGKSVITLDPVVSDLFVFSFHGRPGHAKGGFRAPRRGAIRIFDPRAIEGAQEYLLGMRRQPHANRARKIIDGSVRHPGRLEWSIIEIIAPKGRSTSLILRKPFHAYCVR